MTTRPRAALFTALELESNAVAAHLTQLEFVRSRSFLWQKGVFDEGLGWEVYLVQTGPENAAAGPVVAAALTALAPAVAMFVGIAGGRPRKIEALDVIVPTVVDYLHAGTGELTSRNRPRQQRPKTYMIQAARAIATAGAWPARITGGPPDAAPSVHFEALGSGEQVIKSTESEIYRNMIDRNDKIVAVDMEGTGFYNASELDDTVQHLLVRGISDLIEDKAPDADNARQPAAAAHAAAFAFELLAMTPRDVITLRDLPHRLDPFGSPPARLEDTSAPTGGTLTPPEPGIAPPEITPVDTAADERQAVGELVTALALELYDRLGVAAWPHRTEGLFFGAQPTLPVTFDEQLQDAAAWLAARVEIPHAAEFDAALRNLKAVVTDLRDVFHRHVELDRSGAYYRTEQFYRDYSLTVSAREDLVAQFREHTALVKNLGAEATRAINLVADIVREHHNPQFGLADGAAGIFSDDDFVVLNYTAAERKDNHPYPGLAEFPTALGHRDGVFSGASRAEEWPEDLAVQFQEAVEGRDGDAASSVAFRFAQTVADGLPIGWSTTIASGHERSFEVRIRVVNTQWRSPDGVTIWPPRPHLARTYVAPRGPDESREALVGEPEPGAVGETLEARGGRIMDTLSAHDLVRFARETHALLRASGLDDLPEGPDETT